MKLAWPALIILLLFFISIKRGGKACCCSHSCGKGIDDFIFLLLRFICIRSSLLISNFCQMPPFLLLQFFIVKLFGLIGSIKEEPQARPRLQVHEAQRSAPWHSPGKRWFTDTLRHTLHLASPRQSRHPIQSWLAFSSLQMQIQQLPIKKRKQRRRTRKRKEEQPWKNRGERTCT